MAPKVPGTLASHFDAIDKHLAELHKDADRIVLSRARVKRFVTRAVALRKRLHQQSVSFLEVLHRFQVEVSLSGAPYPHFELSLRFFLLVHIACSAQACWRPCLDDYHTLLCSSRCSRFLGISSSFALTLVFSPSRRSPYWPQHQPGRHSYSEPCQCYAFFFFDSLHWTDLTQFGINANQTIEDRKDLDYDLNVFRQHMNRLASDKVAMQNEVNEPVTSHASSAVSADLGCSGRPYLFATGTSPAL
jgi:hypothetical protein